MRSFHSALRASHSARDCRAFTLVEVLLAMVVMGIVIAVALQGLEVASRAGEYGLRREIAARIAASKLDELVATGQWRMAAPSGTVQEGTTEYRWQMTTEPWTEGTLSLLTLRAYFSVRGREYDVRLSTLADPSLQ